MLLFWPVLGLRVSPGLRVSMLDLARGVCRDPCRDVEFDFRVALGVKNPPSSCQPRSEPLNEECSLPLPSLNQ